MNSTQLDALDLNLLKVLRAIFEERSVTRAGARLGVTQSAVSHALNRLRAALDDPLVVRTPAGMYPTARGAEIAGALPAAFDQLISALSSPGFNPGTSQRTFTIVAGPYACAVILPRLTARVLHEAPNARIHVTGLSGDVIGRLERGEADLLISAVAGDAAPLHLHSEPLFEESLVWVVRARHPLLQAPVTLSRLTAAPHILIENPRAVFDTHDVIRVAPAMEAFHRELDRRGLSQRVGVVVPDAQSAMALVTQTDMAALVPRRLAAMRPPTGALAVIEPPHPSPPIAVGFMARADRLEAPDLAWLTAHLRAVGQSLAG